MSSKRGSQAKDRAQTQRDPRKPGLQEAEVAKDSFDQSLNAMRRAMRASTGKRDKEGALAQSLTKDMVKENIVGSLNDRAKMVVVSREYQQRLKDLKARKVKAKVMDFYMNGVNITMPYSGQKVTSGYLKKETQSIGIMFKKAWQPKYCVLDLQKFEFRYAKNPQCAYTIIPVNSVIDVVVEEDPPKRNADRSVFSLAKKDQASDGFNMQLVTHQRVFRLQASTKVEQNMWIRSFNVMFELRARIINNLKSLESLEASAKKRKEKELAFSVSSKSSAGGFNSGQQAQGSQRSLTKEELDRKIRESLKSINDPNLSFDEQAANKKGLEAQTKTPKTERHTRTKKDLIDDKDKLRFYETKKESESKHQHSVDTGSLKDMDEEDQEVEILDPGKDFTSLRSPKALISKEETVRQKKKESAI